MTGIRGGGKWFYIKTLELKNNLSVFKIKLLTEPPFGIGVKIMRSKKKILFIITYLELGGAQKQLFSIIQALDKNKYDIYLYAGDNGYLKKDFLELPDIKVKLEPFLVREINLLFDITVFLKLIFFIRKNKFDIVHTHSPKASILGRWAAYLAGVKNIIYTVHGWPFHEFINPVIYFSFWLLEKLTAKITTRILVVSKADFNTGVRRKIAPKDKFVLIHYGIDIDKFRGIHLKRKNILSSPVSIVNVSCLKPQKGLIYFLQAAKLILNKRKDLKFFLIGDGHLKRKIHKTIERYGLENNVFLNGWVNDVSSILSKADILVLASLWEGLPVSVIEAVAAGIPVVVTDTGGVRDILENYKNGIIIKSRNKKRLYEAVNSILNNYSAWVCQIEDYRKSIDLSYWSKERMVLETESLYEVL